MKKYAWTFMLVCILFLGGSTLKAQAAENGEYRYEQTTNDYGSGMILVKYLGNAEELEIPEELDGVPVVEIGEDCFSGNETLKKVVIPDSVTRVGGFSNCINLDTVELGNNVRELARATMIEIEHESSQGTFAGCSSLAKIELPDSWKKWQVMFFSLLLFENNQDTGKNICN